MSVTQGILPFKLTADKSKSIVTSFSGLPLVVETMRALKLPGAISKYLRIKQRDSGLYTEADYIESFVCLFASGGTYLDDFERLRSDAGLNAMSFKIPSPESSRFFLYAFHDDEAFKGRPLSGAFVPEETEKLKGLFNVQKALIRAQMRGESPVIATIDQDAVVIESNKEEAAATYKGRDGYQPVINYWAEEDLILKDEFRDGNVPAAYDCLSSLIESIGMLPESVKEVRFRSDSAAYNHNVLDSLSEDITVSGRKARVKYAISADMTAALKSEIEMLSEIAWKPLRKYTDKGLVEGRKEWAEVEYIPLKGKSVNRYLAIRVRPSQGELYGDGNRYRYYAVVTNMWEWDGERLLRWQRERCGTVEHVHNVLKNDLGGGVLPCGRFYANAAWWRLNAIAYNVVSVMKRKALPADWVTYRLKALRYWLIGVAGRVIRTGRQVYLRFCGPVRGFETYASARRRLLEFANSA
jgi:hypothetical protein